MRCLAAWSEPRLPPERPCSWGVLDEIVIPMVISPVLGLILGYFVMTTILWIFRRRHPGRATRGFRYAQTLSAAAMALGHGLQDAGKTMGIIVLALTVGGFHNGPGIPLWVKISAALIISAGTLLRWMADYADAGSQDHSP